jgi:hypothetical protein
VVTLPGHEAFLESAGGQGISYVGRSGWANDWITNWTDPEAYAWWPVKVVAPGRFEVSILYTCGRESLGTRMQVDVGGQTVEGVVEKVHDPAPVASPDRVPRGEVYEKVWAPLTLGTVEVAAGATRLVARALEIPGRRACDVKAVRLRRVR